MHTSKQYEKELDMLSRLHGKGAAIKETKDRLHPELKRDILEMLISYDISDIEQIYRKHKQIIGDFELLGIAKNIINIKKFEVYEQLWVRYELEKQVIDGTGDIKLIGSRNLAEEIEEEKQNLQQIFLTIKTDQSFSFSQETPNFPGYNLIGYGDENGVALKFSSIEHESSAYWVPMQVWQSNMKTKRIELGGSHDIADLLAFTDAFNEFISQAIARAKSTKQAQETAMTQSRNSLDNLGGPLSKPEKRGFMNFLLGADHVFSPARYLAEFERWERNKFKGYLRQYL